MVSVPWQTSAWLTNSQKAGEDTIVQYKTIHRYVCIQICIYICVYVHISWTDTGRRLGERNKNLQVPWVVAHEQRQVPDTLVGTHGGEEAERLPLWGLHAIRGNKHESENHTFRKHCHCEVLHRKAPGTLQASLGGAVYLDGQARKHTTHYLGTE